MRVYIHLRVCVGTWKYISVHVCAHVCVYLTAQVLSEGMVFFVTLPQARRRCSPVRQVLLTGSVNINKNLLPLGANSCRGSAGSHANAGPAQTACKAPRRPAPAACQPADRWAHRGQVWIQAVCALWMIKLRCAGNIVWHWWKNLGSKQRWNI